MALILSECTNSSCKAARTALSQTAPNIVNLAPLLPTLRTGSSSLRGDEQHDFYCMNSSEPTAPNSVKKNFISSRWQWWASHRITLRVTGAAYIIQLIRDLYRLTSELATIVVVVVWYVLYGIVFLPLSILGPLIFAILISLILFL